MFERLTAMRLVTPPAIWGKLPAHADFVRRAMKHGESDGWQPWLREHAEPDAQIPAVGNLPAAFVLPPGTLPFARRRYVLGVITQSCDKVGRRHPLVVYQVAHPRWAKLHFQGHARSGRDWLFWLARAVARHMACDAADDVRSLDRTVRALWEIHEPGWRSIWRPEGETDEHARRRCSQADATLHRYAGHCACDDPAARLHGVLHLPWADWPHRLFKSHASSVFWQQDADGGYVNAAERLAALWQRAS